MHCTGQYQEAKTNKDHVYSALTHFATCFNCWTCRLCYQFKLEHVRNICNKTNRTMGYM